MVTYTECKCGVVYFCTIFKNLLIKYSEMNVEIKASIVSQDMPVFTRDGVEEVWPDSIGLPCSTHFGRKFDDG